MLSLFPSWSHSTLALTPYYSGGGGDECGGGGSSSSGGGGSNLTINGLLKNGI